MLDSAKLLFIKSIAEYCFLQPVGGVIVLLKSKQFMIVAHNNIIVREKCQDHVCFRFIFFILREVVVCV